MVFGDDASSAGLSFPDQVLDQARVDEHDDRTLAEDRYTGAAGGRRCAGFEGETETGEWIFNEDSIETC